MKVGKLREHILLYLEFMLHAEFEKLFKKFRNFSFRRILKFEFFKKKNILRDFCFLKISHNQRLSVLIQYSYIKIRLKLLVFSKYRKSFSPNKKIQFDVLEKVLVEFSQNHQKCNQISSFASTKSLIWVMQNRLNY